MKIALISFHAFINPGGVKRHILGLRKELKRRKVKTKIIAPRRKLSENYGKNIILLGTSFPVKFTGSQADFNVNFDLIAIERTLRKEKFNVLHFHNFGFPSILQILLSPSVFDTLNILTFHSGLKGNKYFEKFPAILYLLNKICQWRIDGVIGVAPLSLDYFKQYDGPKKVIPNGIDLGEFNTRIPKIKRFSDGKINILFVGRIEERKGLIYLLRAYKILQKKFSNLRLIVVGEGPLEKECKSYVNKNRLEEVVFVGTITKTLNRYYRTADIFVSPAIFGESFGLVLLEAMACGTPVVAFANQGYKGFLKGKVGEKSLAKSRDYRGLAKKIEILIKNPRLRKKVSTKGIKEAKEYSWTKVTAQVLDFYNFCKKEKIKKRKNNFSLEKILRKMATKDILEWIDEVIEE